MKKILDNFYIISKLSFSFILLICLIGVLYILYINYKNENIISTSQYNFEQEIKKDIASGNLDFCVASNHTSFAAQYGSIYTDLNDIMPASVLADAESRIESSMRRYK